MTPARAAATDGFFRDHGAWDLLATRGISVLAGDGSSDRPVRVWCTGCGSGRESISVAMLLCEAMGLDAFRARVRIYATDRDEGVVVAARCARYPRDELEDMPPAMRQRYFVEENGVFRLLPAVRGAIVFCRHDLRHDAPFSRIDLLLCRDTTGVDLRSWLAILGCFHLALREGGFLLLGPLGVPSARASDFAAVDGRHPLFTRVASDCHGRSDDGLGASIGPVLTLEDGLSPDELVVAMRVLHERLERAYAELQSTNEELALTNGELRGADREIEALAQELRSTQEDLLVMEPVSSDAV